MTMSRQAKSLRRRNDGHRPQSACDSIRSVVSIFGNLVEIGQVIMGSGKANDAGLAGASVEIQAASPHLGFRIGKWIADRRSVNDEISVMPCATGIMTQECLTNPRPVIS